MKKLIISLSLTLVLLVSLCLAIAVPVIGSDGGSEVDLTASVYTSTLELQNKDASWAVIDDVVGGTLLYNASGSTFEFSFTATVLKTDTSYSLIYYADRPDRYVNWGGDNPGALIGTGTSDGSGALSIVGNPDLGMDLPCYPDANISGGDYASPPDSYAHPNGAKIWLVPSSYLPTLWPNDGSWMNWNADIVSNILFETDLIVYDDTDVVSVPTIGISVAPTAVNFGSLAPGMASATKTVTVTNIGNVAEDFNTTLTNVSIPDAYTAGLSLSGSSVSVWDESTGLGGEVDVDLVLTIPVGTTAGIYTATLIFWAEAS